MVNGRGQFNAGKRGRGLHPRWGGRARRDGDRAENLISHLIDEKLEFGTGHGMNTLLLENSCGFASAERLKIARGG